jgi:hypothetical protein
VFVKNEIVLSARQCTTEVLYISVYGLRLAGFTFCILITAVLKDLNVLRKFIMITLCKFFE